MATKFDTNTVSIITVSQFKRHEYLKILIQIIETQTYKNILEWVIVEGTQSNDERVKHKECMDLFIANSKLTFPIRFIDTPFDTKLGELRNIGNFSCQGDITVCFDDDDFYPSTRIEEAVRLLSSSEKLIAGCSAHYLYDYNLEKLYLMKQLNPNHSVNSNMAWKKEYLKNHKHDPSREFAEEMSFTNNFTEPMIQIDAKHSSIISSHKNNTFNKKMICVEASLGTLPHCNFIDMDIHQLISQSLYRQYLDLSKNDDNLDFDIVYFTGGRGIKWSPTEKSLGGSEQAIVNLSENWVKKNKSVCVYTTVEKPCTLNGVVYRKWNTFPYDSKIKTLIVWRLLGLIYVAPFPIKAEKILLDLHDNLYPQTQQILQKFPKFQIDRVFYKSKYHYECHTEKPESLFHSISYDIIPNGIRLGQFLMKKDQPNIRNLYRFCYCSCYTRGLQHTLEKIWPLIYKNEPRAELHVYYGMDMVSQKEWKEHMRKLLSQPGVMDHGRQSSDIIAREKLMSMFHLYITDTIGEIDCISIRESVASGCIPLLSNFGVFKERDGIHFQFDKSEPKCYTNIAEKILNLLQNAEKLEPIRQMLQQSNLLHDWDTIANKWLECFTSDTVLPEIPTLQSVTYKHSNEENQQTQVKTIL